MFFLFKRKPSNFPWRKKTLNVLRNLTFSVELYGKFAIIWRSKTSSSEPSKIGYFQHLLVIRCRIRELSIFFSLRRITIVRILHRALLISITFGIQTIFFHNCRLHSSDKGLNQTFCTFRCIFARKIIDFVPCIGILIARKCGKIHLVLTESKFQARSLHNYKLEFLH